MQNLKGKLQKCFKKLVFPAEIANCKKKKKLERTSFFPWVNPEKLQKARPVGPCLASVHYTMSWHSRWALQRTFCPLVRACAEVGMELHQGQSGLGRRSFLRSRVTRLRPFVCLRELFKGGARGGSIALGNHRALRPDLV